MHIGVSWLIRSHRLHMYIQTGQVPNSEGLWQTMNLGHDKLYNWITSWRILAARVNVSPHLGHRWPVIQNKKLSGRSESREQATLWPLFRLCPSASSLAATATWPRPHSAPLRRIAAGQNWQAPVNFVSGAVRSLPKISSTDWVYPGLQPISQLAVYCDVR